MTAPTMNSNVVDQLVRRLLRLVACTVDLRYTPVNEAAKRLGIPIAQLNHLLNRDVGRLTLKTLVTITHCANSKITLSITDKEIPHDN